MASEILPRPRLPETLREAASRGKLIPFVGAGASRIAGCPSWGEFADAVLRELVNLGKFTHAQRDQVKHLNPRVRLSIAKELTRRHDVQLDSKALLQPRRRTNDEKARRLYASLSGLASTFVTTNYDDWLDTNPAFPQPTLRQDSLNAAATPPAERTVIHRPSELTAARINQPDTVIHLHGSVRHPDEMILTTSDYLRHYRNDRGLAENPLLRCLEFLFRTKYVLFVGYGLDELEILEFIILKSREAMSQEMAPRHFILEGFFSHQSELAESLDRYYRAFGIELLPFSLDQREHDQLINVLEEFAASIKPSKLMVADERLEMEALLDG